MDQTTNMDALNSRIKKITNELKQYVEIRLDLVILNLGEHFSTWLGDSIQKLVGYVILSIGMLFCGLALAIYIGDILNNNALGYLIVALPLLLMGVFLAKSKPKSISDNIRQQCMQSILVALEHKKNESKNQLSSGNDKEIVGTNE